MSSSSSNNDITLTGEDLLPIVSDVGIIGGGLGVVSGLVHEAARLGMLKYNDPTCIRVGYPSIASTGLRVLHNFPMSCVVLAFAIGVRGFLWLSKGKKKEEDKE